MTLFSLHQVYCHMYSTGEVWTLIARFSNNDTNNWMKQSGDWWYDTNVTNGKTTDPSNNFDMISSAFWLVIGNEFKITRSGRLSTHSSVADHRWLSGWADIQVKKSQAMATLGMAPLGGLTSVVWGIARFNMADNTKRLTVLTGRSVMGPFWARIRSASGVTKVRGMDLWWWLEVEVVFALKPIMELGFLWLNRNPPSFQSKAE